MFLTIAYQPEMFKRIKSFLVWNFRSYGPVNFNCRLRHLWPFWHILPLLLSLFYGNISFSLLSNDHWHCSFFYRKYSLNDCIVNFISICEYRKNLTHQNYPIFVIKIRKKLTLLFSRTDLLSFSLAYCPADMIEPILQAKAVLETQVIY